MLFRSKLDLADIGKVGAVVGLIAMALQYPSGWAVDKFHAVRITLVMKIPVIATQFFAFFFLRDLTTYIILEGIKLLFFTLHGAAGIPMLIMIFPKDKYGQFCSCNGLVRSIGMMVGAIFGAMFMDYMTSYGADKFAFRWMFIWTAGWQIIGLISLIFL